MTTARPFVRDRFTWLAYFLVSYYAYHLSAIGPMLPFLREELNLSYTVGGYHLSAFATGMIGVGLLGDLPTRLLGRKRNLWIGGLGLTLGVILLLIATTPVLTVGGALVMGIFGSIMLSTVQASMADQHGDNRAIPITESNIFASVSSALGPLLIGTFAAIGIGWRAAPLVMIATWAVVGVFGRSLDAPPVSTPHTASKGGRLPLLFWAYWLVIVFGVAVEGSLIFWGADFLEKAVGLSKESASAWMAAFFIAGLIGRMGGSYLARRWTTGQLLLINALLTAVGFPFFWQGQSAPVNLIGLFIAGVGVSNLFPMALAACTGAAPGQPDAASARVFIGSGLALLVTPQVLAILADRMDIRSAYGLVAVLLVLVTVIIAGANRYTRR